ncbi:DNA-binding MurR/RpiR family transcriptional regulator [Lysinibacter cavernae]|uniref:DNA-binding MurR/RpiR family transcriptional regulator n=1 Tax=Lysinibacter cavernae TaxID=1640652 RepID=A0A7X5R3G9_9MICO|nr:DNA-binding MurR/RpiR family transcriptional regulator [Lysinibacter cavernae]
MWSNATQEGTAVVEDVLGTIKRSLATLSATERKVAESVLAEPGVVVENTVTELAERCGVSSATVARFCQTLGFSGYRQFRLEVATTLSREQAERNRFEIVDDEIDPSDGIEDVISKVLYHEVLAIEQTMRGLDRPSVEQASKALVHANRIEVCGFGASGITAHDLHQKLSRIGRPSSYSPDVHFVLPSASLLGKGDVLVAFSHSGATAETLSVCRSSSLGRRDRGCCDELSSVVPCSGCWRSAHYPGEGESLPLGRHGESNRAACCCGCLVYASNSGAL